MFRLTCTFVLICLGVAFGSQEMEARKFKIHSSDAGGYSWECKDGSDMGWAGSRSGARQDARDACGSIANANFTDPLSPTTSYGLQYNTDGDYTGWLVQSLENKDILYSPNEVPENAGGYVSSGSSDDPALSDEAKVIAQLRAWGIYLGGESRAEIETEHNLSADQFDRIRDLDANDGYVTIEDGLPYEWEL